MSKILVVEDHAIAREPLAKLLRYEGYQTACAANGVEALAALEDPAPTDLVLLDVMMPRMTGLAFLEAVRREGRWKNLPVIVLTGVMDRAQIERARELNVLDVFPKARFTVDELLSRIRTHLGA